jgi:hypothetical protein
MTDLLQAAKEVIRQISVEHLSENAVESLRQAINEAENAKQEPVAHPFECWSTNDGDSWFEHPADAQLLYDVLGDDPKVGDEFEVSAGWNCVTATYRIASKDGDDFEVECISHPQNDSAPVQPVKPSQQADASLEPVATDLMDMLRLIGTIKYLRGIAERGLGREIREDETIEQFVLGYVKQLEAAIRATRAQEQAEQEPVAWMNDSTPMGVFARHKEGAKNFGCTIPLYAAPQPVKLAISEEVFNWIDANAPMFVREALAGVDMSPTEQAEQKQMAVLDITYGREPECYATPNAEDLPEGTYRLYAAPVDAKAILEELEITNMNLNCKSVQARLATSWGYVQAEQAEQDLDTCPGCGGVADNGHDREFPPNPYYCTKCTEQAEQEPVKIFFNLALRKMWSGTEIQSWIDSLPPLYAAPVRTKDLTDGELTAIWERNAGDWLACFRAVIAADRELNK